MSEEKKNRKTSMTGRQVWGLWALICSGVNVILLLPCAIITLGRWMGWSDYEAYTSIWVLLSFQVVFLALFKIPYLLFGVSVLGSLILIVIGFRDKKHFRIEHLALAINVISAMGLLSLERVVMALMSV